MNQNNPEISLKRDISGLFFIDDFLFRNYNNNKDYFDTIQKY